MYPFQIRLKHSDMSWQQIQSKGAHLHKSWVPQIGQPLQSKNNVMPANSVLVVQTFLSWLSVILRHHSASYLWGRCTGRGPEAVTQLEPWQRVTAARWVRWIIRGTQIRSRWTGHELERVKQGTKRKHLKWWEAEALSVIISFGHCDNSVLLKDWCEL